MLPEIWRNRDSLLGPSWDDFVESFTFGLPSFKRDIDFTWSPRVDVHESDKEIVIDVEVPGIDKKDIKVEIKDSMLAIKGERKHERKTENNECYREERHYGKFERSFSLPDTVNPHKVNAGYKDGVLTLTLGKNEKAIPKAINIDVK